MTTAATKTAYHFRHEEALAVEAMLRPNGAMRAALLEGPPGCGKTSLASAVAERIGAQLVYHQLHSWSDDQELCVGINVAAAVAGDANEVRQNGVLAVAAEASRRGQVVLCLDEIDKVQERTEYLLLDFLQTGRVPVRPGFHLQADISNLLVFLTSNGARQLSDALLRRVRRVRMQPLPSEVACQLAAEQSATPVGFVRCLYNAAYDVAAADGAVLSVQELSHLAGDIWHVAKNAHDARELLAQWAARGPKGLAMIGRANISPAWGEVMAARRRAVQ